jgi:hypothetical protein
VRKTEETVGTEPEFRMKVPCDLCVKPDGTVKEHYRGSCPRCDTARRIETWLTIQEVREILR